MSRENTYLSIILKKQPYGEGDELVSIYSRETGKMRALAKSTKFAKSKLQYSLQVLFVTKLTLTLSGLSKIIGAEVVYSFPKIRENLQAMIMAFYGLELLLKFTADEEKNEPLFDLFLEYANFLNKTSQDVLFPAGLAKFKIAFLETLGLAIHADPGSSPIEQVGFSNQHGGFIFNNFSSAARPVSLETFRQFKVLSHAPFDDLNDSSIIAINTLEELQGILTGFLEYQLERSVNSELFLKL